MIKLKSILAKDPFAESNMLGDELYIMSDFVQAGGGGKGGSSVVEKPVFVPPPAAPAVQEAATQQDAVSPEEEMARKREAAKQGAKSLQIPVSTGATGTTQVGTGQQ